MARIENFGVQMKFDNSDFQRKTAQTLSSLEKLKSNLNFSGAAKGISGLANNLRGVNLNPLAASVDAVGVKFSALQVTAVAALSSIVSRATFAGQQMVSSLTVGPISGGLGEYEKKLDSIQTILANTQAAGGNLKSVSGALNELNKYSDQTIYNFGEMARNIGTFTAAGVELGTATNSIKGIANLAALSGSSSEQASSAMYQLSQAISAGRVSLMDWNSVVNAGMGGTVFQRALAETAVAMGKLPQSAVKLDGAMKNVKISGKSFRESIDATNGPSWLTSDVLTTALGNFTGDMKEADLVAQGFSKSQAQAIMAQAKVAQNAATIVKTGSKLMDTLKESAESGWASTWELIIGDFNEAPKVWTAINNVVGGFITRSANARNSMLQIWKDNGGRDAFLAGIVNIFKIISGVVKPIAQAFREIFPRTTGQQLADLSKKFQAFTAALIPSSDTFQRIKSVAEGVFSVFGILKDIVQGAATVFLGYFGVISGGTAGTILPFLAVLGEWVRKVRDIINQSGAIDLFFKVLLAPLLLIKPLIGFVVDLAEAINRLLMGDISGFANGIKEAFGNLGGGFANLFGQFAFLGAMVSQTMGKIADFLAGVANRATASGNGLLAFFATIGFKIAKALGNAGEFFQTFFLQMRTGLDMGSGFVGTFVTRVKGLFEDLTAGIQSGMDKGKSFVQSFVDSVTGIINKLLNPMKSVRDSSSTVLSGFAASAFIVVADGIIRLVDGFNQLKASLGFKSEFDGVTVSAGAAGDSLSALGGVGTFIGKILKGVADAFSAVFEGIGPFIRALNTFFTTLTNKLTEWIAGMDMSDAVSVINTGFFIAFYIALRSFLNNISGLINPFSELFTNLGDTLKTFQQNVRANIILKIAIAIAILVAAVKVLSEIDSEKLKKALVALSIMFAQLAATLTIISSYGLSGGGSVLASAAMVVAMAIAIKLLSGAVKELSGLSWEEMRKGLIGVGALLGAMALFTKFVSLGATGVSAGAGLVLLAIGVRILAKAVGELGAMDTGQLIKGIGALVVMVTLLGGMVLIMNATKGIPAAAAGLILLSFALTALLVPLKIYSMMDWSTMGKGLLLIAVTLGAIGLAMRAFPPNMPAIALGLAIVAASLIAILIPIKILAAMSFGELVKGIGALGIVLAILVIAMNAAAGGLPGAAAVALMAVALNMLVPPMLLLSQLSWEGIAKGIVAIAAVLAVITIAMYAMAPVIVILATFALAIRTLGVAMLLAGAGFALFAGAIGVLAVTGAAGFAVILAAITAFLHALPLWTQQFGHFLVTAALVMEKVGPRIIKAFGTVFLAFLAEVRRAAVPLAVTAGTLIMAFVDVVARMIPLIAAKGLDMIIALLNAIKSRISQITNIVIDIFVIFITTVKNRLPTIIQSAIELILAFINGLAQGIRENKERVGNAGKNLATALIDGAISGLTALGGSLKTAAVEVFNKMVSEVKRFLGINSPSTVFRGFGINMIQGAINGIGSMAGNLFGKAREAVSGAVSAAVGALSNAASVGTGFISRAASALGGAASSLGAAAMGAVRSAVSAAKGAIGNAAEIGSNIVSGIARGISNGLSVVTSAAKNLASSALSAAKNFLGIKSPSKEFEKLGEFVNEGFVQGLTGGSSEKIDAAMEQMADRLKTTVENATSDIEKGTEKLNDLTKAQKENSDQRKLDQTALDADIRKLKEMTTERTNDEAAIKRLTAEIVKDREAVKSLTAERNRDIIAVKAAQTELDRDRAQLAQLTSARNQDKEAIAAKRAEIEKDRITLRNLTEERNKDTEALRKAQAELAKDEAARRKLTESRNADREAIAAQTLDIDRQKEKLGDLAAKEKENAAAIIATKDAIAQATNERDRALRASEILSTQLTAEKESLKGLSAEYQSISGQLDEANKSLEAAIKTRDDYKKSVTEKFGDLPDIGKETTLVDYLATLRKKVDDTNAFSAAVQKLRDMGLNDQTYRELVEKGVDALPFVNELLAGGKSAVEEVNNIGGSLLSASEQMGNQASQALYTAGVQTGQGLVNGLKSQLAAVQAAMAALAAAMQAKIKTELKIKSPSRVFMQIGDNTVKGLVNGLKNAQGSAVNAASGLGDGVTNALQLSLANLSTALDGQMNLDPVIRPIMDLSDIEKKAGAIGSLIGVPSVSLDAAYSSAAVASAGYLRNKNASLEESGSVATAPVPQQLTFVQHNTSPKALSEAEIYRQTNNQLSRVKGALQTP